MPMSRAQGIEIVHSFYDAAMSGAELIAHRRGFAAVLSVSRAMACVAYLSRRRTGSRVISSRSGAV
jgi:hypothetical protein